MHTHFRARCVLGPVCGGGPSMRLWRLASRAAAGVMPAAQTPVSGRSPRPTPCPQSHGAGWQRGPLVQGALSAFSIRKPAPFNYRERSHLLGLILSISAFYLDLVVRQSPPMFLISFIRSLPFIILLCFSRDLPTLLLTVNSTVTESISGGSCWPAAVPFFKSLF